ncbi:hypothetical protein [Halalkalibacter akibai]|uniref:Uncharacterized protein n=1 Tax=Halalkalibacter akibai (strain ATCC 43226 / DSM 21942 / CIP 109018 / JCM 9157 / 1139) TaxID=1236973 RepID=W4QRB5_HALA3|nr:hypothetical protein [Halalkalibacter akibai]GAE34636.1 hypothetical protein JCM9157_1706 [Halalkalibacter akibai JCM 9157]
MTKQLFVIGVAAMLFVGVWILVFLQFNEQQHAVEIGSASTFEINNERAFELPESIIQSDKEITVYSDISESVQKLDNKITVKEEKGTVDLRNYDFSDVSTSEGVPIAAILDKLDLD